MDNGRPRPTEQEPHERRVIPGVLGLDWASLIPALLGLDVSEVLDVIDVPTLILHGDDDQIVPIGASAMQSAKLVKGAQLKVYKGGSHGICATQKDEVNADLLAFFKGQRLSAGSGRQNRAATATVRERK